MRLKKREKEKAEITSASMADIAFLLIIFFMVTTVFSATKGLDFKLPEEQEDAPPEEEEAIFFLVLEDGSFLMDCGGAVREDIISYVEPKLANWPDKPIIIYSRPDAPYRTMIEIYDELLTGGRQPPDGLGIFPKVPNISIPTQTEVMQYERLFGQNPFETRCG